MSDGQVVGSECGVAADLLEEEGLANAAAVLREMGAHITACVDVPPGAVFVLELPEGHVCDDEEVYAVIQKTWQRAVPGTTCVLLEDGMKLRAILKGIPEATNDPTSP